MNHIICKFGGSSTANSIQIKKIKNILVENNYRSIVVVSAPGKDENNQTKITDLLYLLYAHIEYNINYDSILASIFQRYYEIVKELKLSNRFNEEFKAFKSSLNNPVSKDYLVSRGEYFNALVISEYLGYEFVDSRDVIHLKHDGTVDYTKTTKACEQLVSKQVVIPGFYASTPEGLIRTFKRGGSDLTGSILAKAINASLYENWTDVSGVYVADPRIILNPDTIEKITYNELRELAFRGANVLQQESIIPLEESHIPLHIKNTNKPEDFGTYIASNIENEGTMITGISGMQNFTSLNISKDSSESFTSVLKNTLEVFTKYNINVEHMPSGIDTFSIIVKTEAIKDSYFEFMSDLRRVPGIHDVIEESNISLIAIVGRNMSNIPGVAGKLFSTLGTNNINIKVIAQTSKEICIIIGVLDKDYKNAVEIIYQEFYK